MKIINQYHQLKINKYKESWNCVLAQGGTGMGSGKRVNKFESFEDALIFKEIFDGFKLPKGSCEKDSRQKAVKKFKQSIVIFNVLSKTVWNQNSINNAMFMLQIQADFEHEQADKIIKLFIKN